MSPPALDPEMVGEVLNDAGSGRKRYDDDRGHHEMDLPERWQNRVVSMDEGIPDGRNTPEEFFSHPKNERLQRLWQGVIITSKAGIG